MQRERVSRSKLVRPTGRFTILEPEDQEIDEFYVVQKRRTMNLGARKF